jgi:tripartite-type tricarboxylate transporter receptor subunit TctC
MIRVAFCLALAWLAVGIVSSTATQDYPERAVTFVVPYAPGGGTDVLGRLLAQELSEKLRQPFVVENRPGAANTIASDLTAK